MAVAGAILSGVESFGHAAEGDVLNNHFAEEFEGLHFQGIVFEMAAVAGDAQAERDFFGAGVDFRNLRLARKLDFALPLERHQAPARVMHFGKINGSGGDRDFLPNAVNLFHRAPPDLAAWATLGHQSGSN